MHVRIVGFSLCVITCRVESSTRELVSNWYFIQRYEMKGVPAMCQSSVFIKKNYGSSLTSVCHMNSKQCRRENVYFMKRSCRRKFNTYLAQIYAMSNVLWVKRTVKNHEKGKKRIKSGRQMGYLRKKRKYKNKSRKIKSSTLQGPPAHSLVAVHHFADAVDTEFGIRRLPACRSLELGSINRHILILE